MRKNDSRQNFIQQTGACALVIGSLALAGDGNAATAAGTATATVLESVSVSISAPPPPPPPPPPPVPAGIGTVPALPGILFTLEGFTGSLSLSGPLLRFGSTPPPGALVTAAQSGSTGAGAAPSAANGANSATVTVTRHADGSLGISGGSGLTFAVSLEAGVVNIEYN